MLLDPFISLFIRTGFAGLFALTALHKLRDLSHFREIIAGYNIVPLQLIFIVVFLLPALELFIAIILVLMPVMGILAACALLGMYAMVLAFNIARGHTQIDCGCFWGGAQSAFPSLNWTQVLRNVGLITVLLVSFIPALDRSYVLMDFVNLGFGLGFAYVAVKAVYTLISVRTRMREFGHA